MPKTVTSIKYIIATKYEDTDESAAIEASAKLRMDTVSLPMTI